MPNAFTLFIFLTFGIIVTTGALVIMYYIDQVTTKIEKLKQQPDASPLTYSYRGWIVWVRYRAGENYPFRGAWYARATKNGDGKRKPMEITTDPCVSRDEAVKIINQEIMRLERM